MNGKHTFQKLIMEGIALCMLAVLFSSGTWAWFTMQKTTQASVITGGTFSVEVKVYEDPYESPAVLKPETAQTFSYTAGTEGEVRFVVQASGTAKGHLRASGSFLLEDLVSEAFDEQTLFGFSVSMKAGQTLLLEAIIGFPEGWNLENLAEDWDLEEEPEEDPEEDPEDSKEDADDSKEEDSDPNQDQEKEPEDSSVDDDQKPETDREEEIQPDLEPEDNPEEDPRLEGLLEESSEQEAQIPEEEAGA